MVFSDFVSVYRSERKSDFPRSGTRARSYALLVPCHRKSDLSGFSSRTGCSVCLCFLSKHVCPCLCVCLRLRLARVRWVAKYHPKAYAASQPIRQRDSQPASQPASQPGQQASKPATTASAGFLAKITIKFRSLREAKPFFFINKKRVVKKVKNGCDFQR